MDWLGFCSSFRPRMFGRWAPNPADVAVARQPSCLAGQAVRHGRITKVSRHPATMTVVVCSIVGAVMGFGPQAADPPPAAPAARPLEQAPTPSVMPPAVHLRCGFGSSDITPHPSVPLMGYPEPRGRSGSDGVHLPLLARACVLKEGSRTAVLVGLDLCVLPNAACRRLRTEIAQSIDTDAAHVLVSTSHTHSGPFPSDDYLQSIQPKILDAVRRANDLCHPVTAWIQEAALGLGYNRRVLVDGTIRMCWNPQTIADHPPRPAPDPTCTLLQFRQVNGPRQVNVWSLGAHPVVFGKASRMISSDYPGAACTWLDANIPDGKSLFVLGAAGNVHPWMATQEDPRNVDRIGETAGAFVRTLAQATRPIPAIEGGNLVCRSKTVVIRGHEIDIAVWHVGAAFVVAAPVELFGELAVDLRRRLERPVLLATLTNGWNGYWPHRGAFAEGGYEVGAAPAGLEPGDGEALIDQLVELARHEDR